MTSTLKAVNEQHHNSIQYRELQDLRSYTLSIILLTSNELQSEEKVSVAIKCLVDGCDELAESMFESEEIWKSYSFVDRQSITARLRSAQQLAEMQWEDGNHWLLPVHQLIYSVDEDLTNFLLCIEKMAQQEASIL